jgi:hypothetical protein
MSPFKRINFNGRDDNPESRGYFDNSIASGKRLLSRVRDNIKLRPTTITGGNATFPAPDGIYHIFTSSGSLVVGTAKGTESIEYLVVAGGGAGAAGNGTYAGGGGGAGGFRTGSLPLSVGNSTYPVTVGGGGSPNADPGTPSNFGPIISTGGGGGGPGDTDGSAGGSGGGGGGGDAGAANVIPQGFDGGAGSAGGGGGGGGGGAGSHGMNYNSGAGVDYGAGHGGVGLAAFSGTNQIPPSYGTAGPPSTPTGPVQTGRWFAGGGGAGNWNPSYGNSDGTGLGGCYTGPDGTLAGPGSDPVSVSGQGGAPYSGGGRGAYGTSGASTAGGDNTGGGGGGGGNPGHDAHAAGGSGIVIVRYPSEIVS